MLMMSCACLPTNQTQVLNYISWEHLPDPDASVPTAESALSELFQEIRTTVGQEVQIVQAVFPNPAYVMQVFLQRVFAQSVGSLLPVGLPRFHDMCYRFNNSLKSWSMEALRCQT